MADKKVVASAKAVDNEWFLKWESHLAIELLDEEFKPIWIEFLPMIDVQRLMKAEKITVEQAMLIKAAQAKESGENNG